MARQNPTPWPLLAAGVLDLAVTSYLALLRRASRPCRLPAPRRSLPERPWPSARRQPSPPRPLPQKPVMDAGREAACQAEFDKVVREEPIDFLADGPT